MRLAASLLIVCLAVAACTAATGPAGVPSSTDVNPITGARGGTNGR